MRKKVPSKLDKIKSVKEKRQRKNSNHSFNKNYIISGQSYLYGKKNNKLFSSSGSITYENSK